MASSSGTEGLNGSEWPGKPDTPLPTNSVPFEFTCQCLNLRVEGRVASEDSIPDKAEGSSTRYQVWLGDYAESGRFPVYFTWEQDDLGPDSAVDGAAGDDSSEPALRTSWRKCCVCDTRCYFSPGKDRWATIDLSTGIRWGSDLYRIDQDNESDPNFLPYSQLYIPLPTGSSTFGRPPSTNFPTLYPPTNSSDEPQYFVLPVQDPFFLPPPFIPSHPQLRSLCENGVVHLRRRHDELEHQVREYIATKSREMRDTEEKIRAEVELLWERYKSGPGKGEDLDPRKPDTPTRPAMGEPKRSRTVNGTIQPSVSSTAPSGQTPTNNPILMEAARNPAYPTGSLLAQSLSANPYAASPPAPVADTIDDSFAAASKYGKRSDARAVAMSHVFSVLDEAMASRGPSKLSMSLDDAYVETEYDEAKNEEIIEKDSWVDDETAQREDEDGLDVPNLDTQASTPRPKPQSQPREPRPSKGKEKAVTFEEPAVANAEYSLDDEAIEDGEPDEHDGDDYVFDFDMDEPALQSDPDDIVSATPPQPPRTFSRTRNMVEANLSRTFAADAPSHRSAWKRHLEKGTSMLDSIRRPSDTIDDEVSSEGSISQLATSMPVAIVLAPIRRVGDLPPRERKTSLTDRTGLLVPPLRAAMREPSLSSINAHGLSPSRPSRDQRRASKTTRSASASREREQVTSFKLDPGAVFESLADDAVGSDEEEDQEGTLRESKTFMPPHEVIKREEDRQGPDVGWRSMAGS